jgi:AraC family transcriptional regulator
MTETPAEADLPSVIATLAQRRRQQPTYVVRGDRFYAAKWTLPPHRVTSGECNFDHILLCRLEGETSAATKTVDSRAIRKHTRPGDVTFIPSGEYAHYALERSIDVLELYISPTLVQKFSEQHVKDGRAASIRPVFAEEDLWLAGYFRMLESEINSFRDPAPALDALLLGQAQQLLLGHLLRRYSDLSSAYTGALDPTRAGYALRPHLLRRVTDFIEANLPSDIRLGDLARLAHLSERHFIRAFRAAIGCTPYQYVLERRLRACAELLHVRPNVPIADVAASMGFNSQSYFATKFSERYGVTPSRYRGKKVSVGFLIFQVVEDLLNFPELDFLSDIFGVVQCACV